MKYLQTYLNNIINRGNYQLANSINKTANDVGNKYLSKFSFISHEIGLLFGNVQSGKTGQMFGILCKAADLGFPAFILLTTDNILLQQQTLERVKSDLDGFCVCGEADTGVFVENRLETSVIVVLKKNSRILRLWANVFNSTGFMKGNPLFIIDDEADAASLNTLVNKNGQSAVNRYLESIIKSASSSLYLQVTGTPQAIFLQTQFSGWHPLFTYYFNPGKGYLGGDFFFRNGEKPDCITFVDSLRSPERTVVLRHIAVSAQIFASGGVVSNCLVHPSVRQVAHQTFANRISKELIWCKENFTGDFSAELQKQYELLQPAKEEKKPFKDIFEIAKSIILNEESKVIIMNGTTAVESSYYLKGCNFIIGGNTLGRGVTFPSLQTIYYTRSAKKPQADTMWQHSRMFGYDRDPGLMMVFIDQYLYKLFTDINATNNSIIAQVERGIEAVKIFYPKGLNPTRNNVLDNNFVGSISGGTNYYPVSPKNSSIEDISELLALFSDNEPYYQVSLRFIKNILLHIIPSPDFKLQAFQSVLDTILSENPASQGVLIVRRQRDVTQGTGALLSPNDWQLGASFTDKLVLTMYQVTGTKGWGGQPLWVPNIKLPDNMVYYEIFEEDS